MAFIFVITHDNENIFIINCRVLTGRKNALGDYYCISSSCDKILKFSEEQIIEQESE